MAAVRNRRRWHRTAAAARAVKLVTTWQLDKLLNLATLYKTKLVENLNVCLTAQRHLSTYWEYIFCSKLSDDIVRGSPYHRSTDQRFPKCRAWVISTHAWWMKQRNIRTIDLIVVERYISGTVHNIRIAIRYGIRMLYIAIAVGQRRIITSSLSNCEAVYVCNWQIPTGYHASAW